MSNQIIISSGAKVRNLDGVLTANSGIVNSVGYGTANGVATLDSSGKVPLSQLPASVVTYLGTWNAATNTPTLANGTGDVGDLYICNVAGTVNFGAGPITFAVGDWVIYNGSQWQKSAGASGTVTSVAVSSTGNDAISITGSPITTAGTINIGFTGTSAQYVNGAGDLTTFPSLTGFVPYTGATTNLNLGAYDLYASKVWLYDNPNSAYGSMELTDGVLHFEDVDGHSMVTMEDGYLTIANASTIRALLNVTGLTANRDYAFPNASGTISLLERTQTFTGDNTFQGDTTAITSSYFNLDGIGGTAGNSINFKQYTTTLVKGVGYSSINAYDKTQFVFYLGNTTAFNSRTFKLDGSNITVNTSKTFSFPDINGTFALLEGTQTFTGDKTFSGDILATNYYRVQQNATLGIAPSGYSTFGAINTKLNFGVGVAVSTQKVFQFETSGLTNNTTRVYTLPDASGTLALTSNLSSYVPYTGATTNVDLGIRGLFAGYLQSDGLINIKYQDGNIGAGVSYGTLGLQLNQFFLTFSQTSISTKQIFNFPTTSRTYTLPDATGTLALTSDLSGYVPYSGATGNVNLGTRNITSNGITSGIGILLSHASQYGSVSGYTAINGVSTGIQIVAGATTTANLIFPAATYSYTYPASTGTLVLGTGTTNYLPKFTGASTIGDSLIYSNTGVAIGGTTITDSNLLNVIGDSASVNIGVVLNNTNATNAKIYGIQNVSKNLVFYDYSSSATRMTITNTGNVGIGTTSPSSILDIQQSSTTNVAISFMNTYGATSSTAQTVDIVSKLVGSGLTGQVGSMIRTGKEGDYSSGGARDAYMSFSTAQDDTLYERMRITSGGDVLIGTTSSGSTFRVKCSVNDYTKDALYIENSSSTILFEVRGDGLITTGGTYGPYNFNPGGRVMYVNSSGQVGSNPSTRESKININPISDVSYIYDLNPVSFYFRKTNMETYEYTDEYYDEIRYGFIADEVEPLNTDLVSYDINEDGTKKMAGVEYMSMIPVLVKALQEQKKIIDNLSDKVTALENKA